MKVYRIRVEPTERGELYTIGCANCGFSSRYELLLLVRPGRTDSIVPPSLTAPPPPIEAELSHPLVAFVSAPAPLPEVKPRRKAAPRPKAKPRGKAKRR